MLNRQLQEVCEVLEEICNRVGDDEVQYCCYVLQKELLFRNSEDKSELELEMIEDMLTSVKRTIALKALLKVQISNFKNFTETT